MSKSPSDFFNNEVAQHYDERNSRLSAISGCLHFLMTLVLKNIPARAKVLCVGAGTGAEILTLARAFPEWSFVALEPSLPMLEVCRERLKSEGMAHRCDFIHGYTRDLPPQADFDATLSLLVAHFVKREDRPDFFKQMSARLKKGGYLVNAEISFDLSSKEFPAMLKSWEAVQTMMGATPESLAGLPKQLKEVLAILPPSETEAFIKESGIDLPIRFFQAFMICGWYGIRN